MLSNMLRLQLYNIIQFLIFDVLGVFYCFLVNSNIYPINVFKRLGPRERSFC